LSFKEYLGRDEKNSVLPSVATGFGAGIGREGFVCGALVGAIMAIGMKFGRTDPKDIASEEKVNEKCAKFWDLFEKEFGGNQCCNLTGWQFESAKEREKLLAEGALEKCVPIIEKTAQMLFDYIERT